MINKKAEYRKLKLEWYKKLKDTGFNDIEKDEDTLVKPVNSVFSRYEKKHNLVKWKAKQEYYLMASHFLNSYEFDKPLHAAIWEYHCEGMGVRSITKALAAVKIETNRTTVWQIVKRYQEIMRRMMWMDLMDTDFNDEQ